MSDDSESLDISSKASSSVEVNADVRFQFENNEIMDIFFNSFYPELNSLPTKRTRFTLSKIESPKPVAVFHIECDDLIAFRATINHFIIFASTIEKTIKLIESKDL